MVSATAWTRSSALLSRHSKNMNENNDVAAINALSAFVDVFEAQRGRHMSDTEADILIAAVAQIIAVLGGQ